jgi:hypothetical protein
MAAGHGHEAGRVRQEGVEVAGAPTSPRGA